MKSVKARQHLQRLRDNPPPLLRFQVRLPAEADISNQKMTRFWEVIHVSLPNDKESIKEQTNVLHIGIFASGKASGQAPMVRFMVWCSPGIIETVQRTLAEMYDNEAEIIDVKDEDDPLKRYLILSEQHQALQAPTELLEEEKEDQGTWDDGKYSDGDYDYDDGDYYDDGNEDGYYQESQPESPVSTAQPQPTAPSLPGISQLPSLPGMSQLPGMGASEPLTQSSLPAFDSPPQPSDYNGEQLTATEFTELIEKKSPFPQNIKSTLDDTLRAPAPPAVEWDEEDDEDDALPPPPLPPFPTL